MPSRRSECNRSGEPDSHKDAARNVAVYLENRGFVCKPYTVLFSEKYRKIHKISYPGHTYDIGVFVKMDKPKNGLLIKGIIEIGDIGDDSKHNPGHKSQLINDGVAEKYARTVFPNIFFIRINKDDSWYPSWIQKKLGI
jgi:hypothetical protein